MASRHELLVLMFIGLTAVFSPAALAKKSAEMMQADAGAIEYSAREFYEGNQTGHCTALFHVRSISGDIVQMTFERIPVNSIISCYNTRPDSNAVQQATVFDSTHNGEVYNSNDDSAVMSLRQNCDSDNTARITWRTIPNTAHQVDPTPRAVGFIDMEVASASYKVPVGQSKIVNYLVTPVASSLSRKMTAKMTFPGKQPDTWDETVNPKATLTVFQLRPTAAVPICRLPYRTSSFSWKSSGDMPLWIVGNQDNTIQDSNVDPPTFELQWEEV